MEIVRKYILGEKLHLNSRKREKVYKRSYMYAYLRYTYNKSLESIATEFNRNHATVIHGLKLYNDFKTDKYFLNIVEETSMQFPMGIFVSDNNSSCLMFEILNKQEILILK